MMTIEAFYKADDAQTFFLKDVSCHFAIVHVDPVNKAFAAASFAKERFLYREMLFARNSFSPHFAIVKMDKSRFFFQFIYAEPP